jgi:hypothetical protein
MRRSRREFTIADQVAIVRRATDSSWRIHCERCGVWCKSRKDYAIDHIIAEGMRPEADRKRKLTPADGQLLCVAVCHPPKTRAEKGDIAEAKRREAAELGIERPGKSRFLRPPRREKKPTRPVADGTPAMARRFQ